MTLHKAQGLTVDHALPHGSQALTREAGYVGLSRGRRENHIYTTAREMSGRNGECDFHQPDPLATNSSRSQPSPDGCTPGAHINSRATSNRAAGHASDRTTKDPATKWKA
jgi:hypothetical protein